MAANDTDTTNVKLDEFVVMPNHIHGIIIIQDIDGRGESQFAPTRFTSPSGTIGAIVRGFKSASTKRINQLRNTPGLSIWQRNYFEHIIRNQKSLTRIRDYLVTNPQRWGWDHENPNRSAGDDPMLFLS